MNKIAEHKRRIRKRSRFWKSSGTIWISHSPRTLFGIGFMPMHIPFLPRLFSRLNNLVPPVLLHTKRQLSSLEIFGEMIGRRKRRKPTNHSYYKNQRNSILPVPFLKKKIGNQPIIIQQEKHEKGRILNHDSRITIRVSSRSSPPLMAKYPPISGRRNITIQIAP